MWEPAIVMVCVVCLSVKHKYETRIENRACLMYIAGQLSLIECHAVVDAVVVVVDSCSNCLMY